MGGRARGGLALLGIALLALPPAAAQLDGAPPLVLQVAPLDGPVVPLGPFKAAVWHLIASCRAVLPASAGDPAADTLPADVTVTDLPGWLTATVTPSTVYLDVAACRADPLGTVGAEGEVLVSTDADGEAFRAVPLGLAADGGALGTANATLDAMPGFFSQVEAKTPTNIFKLGPGESVLASIEVANLGNAPVTLTFSLKEEPATVRVTLPGPGDLAFGRPSPPSMVKDVLFEASSGGDIYVNRVDAITVVVSSAYALDPTLQGDSDIVSFLITTKGIPMASGDTLGPGAALVALAAVGVLVGVRRLQRR